MSERLPEPCLWKIFRLEASLGEALDLGKRSAGATANRPPDRWDIHRASGQARCSETFALHFKLIAATCCISVRKECATAARTFSPALVAARRSTQVSRSSCGFRVAVG
jgi:hypothetical protein